MLKINSKNGRNVPLISHHMIILLILSTKVIYSVSLKRCFLLVSFLILGPTDSGLTTDLCGR